MDKENDFTAFFENGFAKDFLSCNDYTVRRAVTGISASCELLRGNAEKSGDKKSLELIDCIMKMCCELMRNAELSRALSSEKPADADLVTVRAAAFMKDFVKGCVSASGGRCTVELKEVPDVLIRTEKDLLRMLLLGFIRKCMMEAGDEKIPFELECSAKLKTLNITVRSLGTFVDGGILDTPDVFGKFYAEVCHGLAGRTGASAELAANSLTVVIPLTDDSGTAIIEAFPPESEAGFFEPFSLMLGDI